jgi:hypothetical protein
MNEIEDAIDKSRDEINQIRMETQLIKTNTETKLVRLEEQVNSLAGAR